MDAAPPDFELLDRWATGDQAAGQSLFDRHFRALFRFFRNKAQSGVEDLVQRTFLACVEAKERFRAEASFRTFLFQTARNQLFLHYRELKRNPHLDVSAMSAAALGTSPSAAAVRRQEQQLLQEALRRIPLDAQIVLELAFWEEMSGPEIAAVLEVPSATARTRLRRALLRLRSELASVQGNAPARGEADGDFIDWARQVRRMFGPPEQQDRAT
jgi:RNA polymerase sigma-70 factor (ECF subfamily)